MTSGNLRKDTGASFCALQLMTWGNEASSFSCFADGLSVRLWWMDNLIAPGKASIVKALTQKNNIGNRVVYGENDHGGYDALQGCTKDIEDVAGKPDDEELK
jgi:hypothetical protein